MPNPNMRSAVSKILVFVNLSKIPGPRGFDYLVRFNRFFKTDILGAFTQVHVEYGAIASFPWPMNSVIIYSPEFVRKVLQDEGKKYIKGEQIEELRAVVGNGLATNNDQKSWLKSRSIISKEFGPKAVVEFTQAFERITREYLAGWETDSLEIDLVEEMKFLTFKIGCETLLKADLGKEDSRKVNEAVHFTSHAVYERIFQFLPIPYSWPTAKNKKFDLHFNNLNNLVMKLIKDEQSAGKKARPVSVLEKLVHAVDDETGTGLSDDELRDEVLTMLLAGHETSAHSLIWIVGLLAQYQDVQQKLFENLEGDYLKQVILEGMRLYPAFPVLSRKAAEDVTLGPYSIPKNTNVVIPIFVMQRDGAYWENPLEFRPERFAATEQEKSGAFLPFSRGTRKCVAELFAMAEITIIVKQIISKYHLELVEAELPAAQASVTLKPVAPVRVRISERSRMGLKSFKST